MIHSYETESKLEFFDRASSRFVSHQAGLCAFVSLMLTAIHLVFMEDNPYLKLDLLGVGIFATAHLVLMRFQPKPRYGNVIYFLMGSLMVSLAFLESFAGQETQVVHYLQILIIAGALTFVRWPWLVSFHSLTLGLWAWLGPNFCPNEMTDATVSLLIAGVIGWGGFVVRTRLFEQRYASSQVEATRQKELREALDEGQSQREALLLQEAHQNHSLKLLQEELELIREERSQTEHDLMHSQAMDSLGRLAGGLAHQLNNSLTIISGALELNGEELQQLEDGEDLLVELKEAIDRGGELAGRLVTVSGSLVVHRHSVRVSQIAKNLRRLIGSHRLERIKFVEPEEEFSVWVDEGAWLQMLHNLVGNGMDAAGPEGSVEFEIKKSGTDALFLVRDSGPGIPEEDKRKIFEPYFTTKERGSGTGLGLSIAAGVVEKHCGTLELLDSHGAGSTFCATIPLTKVAGEAIEPEPQVKVNKRQGGTKVLLVEDEPAILRVASRHLTKLGFDVTATTKPREALDLLGQDAFDVVVSDIVMPDLDGPDLIRAARKTVPNLPVIYVSGYTDDRLKGTGLDRQRDAFLKKPYSLPVLAKLIDDTLEKTVKCES